MKENVNTVSVRNLTVGMVVKPWSSMPAGAITSLEVDSRKDGYWIEGVGFLRTHRWYRETVICL